MGDKQGMSFTPRSGDTHVIGDDGAAVNVDAQARDVALADIVDTIKGPDGEAVTLPEVDLTDPPSPLAPASAGRKAK
ncbi:hypothetical protein [Sphingobium sp. MI1205]|uniref:hypothetical protein n=1 Tax=Sphingobium sp. MI1205 TaxID=407020 RepID=UPI00076FEE14|nr:hypothetical protein [Sphingobium sp. MI1205]AMK18700.1 hypothetical protein K663_11605 [Sphingobium sp. MI1205]